MKTHQKPGAKKVIVIIEAVLGACLLVGAGIWLYQGSKAKAALESDLARITAEDVTFVSMSYADTPGYASYGTQDAERIKEAIGWIRNAGFHETFSVPADRYDWFFYDWFPELRPVGGHQPCYTFTLRDGSKLHFFYSGEDRIEYNGWSYRVDDAELAVKFRALYDSVKENAQTYPHQTGN